MELEDVANKPKQSQEQTDGQYLSPIASEDTDSRRAQLAENLLYTSDADGHMHKLHKNVVLSKGHVLLAGVSAGRLGREGDWMAGRIGASLLLLSTLGVWLAMAARMLASDAGFDRHHMKYLGLTLVFDTVFTFVAAYVVVLYCSQYQLAHDILRHAVRVSSYRLRKSLDRKIEFAVRRADASSRYAECHSATLNNYAVAWTPSPETGTASRSE